MVVMYFQTTHITLRMMINNLDTARAINLNTLSDNVSVTTKTCGRYTDEHEYPDPVRGKQAFRPSQRCYAGNVLHQDASSMTSFLMIYCK